jgi:hypothetical protein
MFCITEKHSVAIARETAAVSSMSDANIRDGYSLWIKRAGQGWTQLGIDILKIYSNEMVSRGLYKMAPSTTACLTCGASIGECDGYCTALPNELDDESENN